MTSTAEGVLDSSTGLVWQEFASLAAGQALGYRLATDVEFTALLGHAGLNPRQSPTPSIPEMMYPGDPPLLFNAQGQNALLDISTQLASKAPLIGPGVVIGYWQTQDLARVANTRDGQGEFLLAGLVETTSVNTCQVIGGGNPVDACGTTTYAGALLDRTRLIGQVSSQTVPNGADTNQYRTYIDYLGYTPASDLAYAAPDSLGYHMVRAVPEPGTWALMGAGLIAVALQRRRAAVTGA